MDEIIAMLKEHDQKIKNEMMDREDAILQAVIDEAVNLFCHMRDVDEFEAALMTTVLINRRKWDVEKGVIK